MTIVERGITWSGDGTDLSLFVVWPTLPPLEPDFAFESGTPDRLSIFHLEDETNVLDGLLLTEYDLHFQDFPPLLSDYLTTCLQSVVVLGARVAWFGGEESFAFDKILSGSVANLIYGVSDSEGSVFLALQDEELRSAAWAGRLVEIRESLRSLKHPVRARIIAFESAAIDLDRFSPKHLEDVGVSVRMVIRADPGPGEGAFEVIVCTPQNLMRVRDADEPIIGQHRLIVGLWDWPQIRAFLTHTVELEVAPTWGLLCDRINRIARWEYEEGAPNPPYSKPSSPKPRP